jgi:peptide chain release factor subunit 1
LVNDETFGFIIIDGNSALIAKVKGGHKETLKEVKSDIMRNHNKGGQSSVRFSRLRDESRYNFVKVACE